MNFYWFEAKQLDRATNFSTRIEIIKYGISRGVNIFYYCTYAKEKKYYGLVNNIIYLNKTRSKIIKALEFRMLVVFTTVKITILNKRNSIMVNPDLIYYTLPAVTINKILKRKNVFIVDVRTTPTNPGTFDSDMKRFHRSYRFAVGYYDGLSFITPFMETFLMKNYPKNYKKVIWTSGVDVESFDPEKIKPRTHYKFTLFYHGGISISRGNLDLIRACEVLMHEGYDLELIQVGITVDKEIKRYIEESAISSWCKLLPPVLLEEIPQMIANCDLPVMPFPDFMAWRVSSPIKLMEYLAMGKKVLVPNMECFTDVFGSRSDLVFYYESKSKEPVKEIANAIRRILDNNALAYCNFYAEIRAFVLERYTWQTQAAKLFDFCRNL